MHWQRATSVEDADGWAAESDADEDDAEEEEDDDDDEEEEEASTCA